jgi:hypothetical protein
MRRHVLLAVLVWTTAAASQPLQPMPTVSAPVGDLLASAPYIDITNGPIAARIAPPDPERGFYRGTRFDQSGIITSLRFHDRQYYGPWFDRTAPYVRDYAYDASGAVVAGPDSAVSGPAEEFAPLNFAPHPGLFVKIGVGVLRQPDDAAYDHYRHYQIVDQGRRTTKRTRNSVLFTQMLKSGDLAYTYKKSVRLVDGKSQLIIGHSLQNTGKQTIDTSVYDHNFLRLVPGDAGIRVRFTFPIVTADPPAADLIRLKDGTLTYLRSMTLKERISFPIKGFGATAADYDIKVEDSANGAGVRIQGDRPLIMVNIFSIDKVQAVEPYIALKLAPGQEMRWRYVYTFAAGSPSQE